MVYSDTLINFVLRVEARQSSRTSDSIYVHFIGTENPIHTVHMVSLAGFELVSNSSIFMHFQSKRFLHIQPALRHTTTSKNNERGPVALTCCLFCSLQDLATSLIKMCHKPANVR